MSSCPFCNAETLIEISTEKTFVSNGNDIGFRYKNFHCSSCEAEFVSEAQSVENKRQKRTALKHANGTLSGVDICALRQKYRLTQSQAALMFGGGPVAFSKYESESILPSDAMSTLLVVAQNFPQVVSFLAERNGFKWTSLQWGEQANPGAIAAYARSRESAIDRANMFVTNLQAAIATVPHVSSRLDFSFSLDAANDELCEAAA